MEVETLVTNGDDILLSFAVLGSENLVVPEPTSPGRCDNLWKTTCFECFLKPVSSESYFEFNFSPSGQWAAYRFDAYRQGLREMALGVEPHIQREDDGEPDRYACGADLDLSEVPNTAVRMGLSAVIEERDGRKSYWALAHPPGPPDFHHPDCFALELPPSTPA